MLANPAQPTISVLAEKLPALNIDVGSFAQLDGNTGANTKLSYFYRDADNYKMHASTILPGAISLDQLETIGNHLDEEGGFIPGQVGLDDLQLRMIGGWKDDVDHPFHDISSIELTLEEADNTLTPEDLADEFAEVSWDQEYRP